MTATTGRRINPFVGLRPFRTEESALFFGRREQTTQLLERLYVARFVAVLGYSGSGKSSLVLAGLIPKLLGGFLVKDCDRWCVAPFRPGDEPARNLASALHAALAATPDGAPTFDEIHGAVMAADPDALTRIVAEAVGRLDTNLLILIDQFEELFRFGAHTDHRRAAKEAFVRGTLALAAQRQASVYVVLTMRSDFVGECAFYPDLPEAINASVYLIPQMTRDELREAIEGPARLAGTAMSPGFVDRLHQDVERHWDQLPILQHALMRTWWRRQERDAGDGTIDVEDYEAIGGLQQALNRHLDRVLAEFDAKRLRLAEKIFKCLTEMGPDNRQVRRPTTVERLCSVAGASEPQVIEVVDAFRRTGRSFLMPPPEVALSTRSTVDVSHESLIRNWQRLVDWVNEEATSARMYRRLVESARLYEKGQAGPYRDPELAVALEWRERTTPTAAWAENYGDDFIRAMRFLETSREWAASDARARAASQHVRVKQIALVLAGFVAGALLSWLLL